MVHMAAAKMCGQLGVPSRSAPPWQCLGAAKPQQMEKKHGNSYNSFSYKVGSIMMQSKLIIAVCFAKTVRLQTDIGTAAQRKNTRIR